MLKFTKFVVLGAGVLGLIAFFMPLMVVKSGNFEGKASAFDVVKGLDKLEGAAAKADEGVEIETEAGTATLKTTGAKDTVNTAKWLMFVPFLPCALFVLFSVVGVLKKRFGRLAGAGTFVFGLIGLGIYALISAAAKETGAEDALGSGITMLMISYVLGTLGGLVALIKPEAKAVAAPAAPPMAPPQAPMPQG